MNNLFRKKTAGSRTSVFDGFGYSLSHWKLWRFIFTSKMFVNISKTTTLAKRHVIYVIYFWWLHIVRHTLPDQETVHFAVELSFVFQLKCMRAPILYVLPYWIQVLLVLYIHSVLFLLIFKSEISVNWDYWIWRVLILVFHSKVDVKQDLFLLFLVWLWSTKSWQKRKLLTNWCIVKQMKWKEIAKAVRELQYYAIIGRPLVWNSK